MQRPLPSAASSGNAFGAMLAWVKAAASRRELAIETDEPGCGQTAKGDLFLANEAHQAANLFHHRGRNGIGTFRAVFQDAVDLGRIGEQPAHFGGEGI